MSTAPARIQRTNRYGRSSRHYNVGGVEYPSVTTILGVAGKPALIPWAAKLEREVVVGEASRLYEEVRARQEFMPAAFFESTLVSRLGKTYAHDRELKKAGDIGTEVHAAIEWELRRDLGLSLSNRPVLTGPAAVAFEAWVRWASAASFEVEAVEDVVYSHEYRFAGTFDWIGRMTHEGERIRVLGDNKTGKAIYPEMLLQNAAYVYAALEMGLAETPTYGCIVRLPKKADDPGFEVRVIDWQDHADNFAGFLAVLDMWRWMERQ